MLSFVPLPKLDLEQAEIDEGNALTHSIADLAGYAAIALVVLPRLAQAALEETAKYVVDRKQFEQPISEFQLTQYTLGKMAAQIAGARAITYAAARAFDRIMLWNFYHVPGLVRPGYRLTYWDRFGQPKTEPLSRPTYLDTWWWDAERAARVDAGMTALDAPDEG